MFMTRRPRIIAACTIALLTVAVAQPVQAESWTYRADLGGWLDNETGLVWARTSTSWYGNTLFSFDAARLAAIPYYRQLTGNNKWRLPTLQESQTATQHNFATYMAQTWEAEAMICWTSTEDGKKRAWTYRFVSGIATAFSKASALGVRPVYRP